MLNDLAEAIRRWTGKKTAAQSLPWQVSNQRYKIFFWSCKSSTRLREPPELGKKSLQTIDYKSSTQHYETLLRDALRCRFFFPTNAFMAFARSFNMFYCMLTMKRFLACSKPMSAACLSWATICIAPCDCCFGWIRFGYWAGGRRGFG